MPRRSRGDGPLLLPARHLLSFFPGFREGDRDRLLAAFHLAALAATPALGGALLVAPHFIAHLVLRTFRIFAVPFNASGVFVLLYSMRQQISQRSKGVSQWHAGYAH